MSNNTKVDALFEEYRANEEFDHFSDEELLEYCINILKDEEGEEYTARDPWKEAGMTIWDFIERQ